MLSVKISGLADVSKFNSTIKTIITYISGKLHFSNTRIISDSKSTEITAGSYNNKESKTITLELSIKKTITIDESELDDLFKLDKLISEVKNFCNEAKIIEEWKYKDLEFR